ncbi:hypothetical protein [Streptomyces sp. 6-11-2]|uniref:hypothetical protein n=1 Tax=Streptomyces sp. 6-11-2 TaxID=2585753 RepID=UPI00155A3A57|nr:hypothetical protein [Streptomyces sp. 6-11-2]
MAKRPVDVAQLAAVDPAQAAGSLSETRSVTLTGRRARVAPRPVIGHADPGRLSGGTGRGEAAGAASGLAGAAAGGRGAGAGPAGRPGSGGRGTAAVAAAGVRVAAVGRTATAAAVVAGMPYAARIPRSKSRSAGPVWPPAAGLCSLEPPVDRWLARARGGPAPHDGARIVLDPARPRRRPVTVLGGEDSWIHELSPRPAELFCPLAVHRTGRSASQPAGAVFGDPARKVTVRAGMSRVRRCLGPFLEHRPCRFRERTDVELLPPDDPDDPDDLLPPRRHRRYEGSVSSRCREWRGWVTPVAPVGQGFGSRVASSA